VRVRGAKVRFAGHRARTSRSGRAKMKLRLRRVGRRHAVATKKGLWRGRATVRVRRPRRG
jgi:hypothetical protein